MDKNKSHVVLVLDRSGSMQSCREDSEGGVNAFIKEQQKLPGNVSMSIYQFDTDVELVCDTKPVSEVEDYKLEPRGMTALFDAIGRAIRDTGVQLAAMKEEDRPALVTVMIVTDGGENASREYTQSLIKSMIEDQKNVYSWQFSFLGANQDAFLTGGSLGIDQGDIANYTTAKSGKAFAGMSGKFARMHAASMNANTAEERTSALRSVSAYTDVEREEMS